jgi:hypothetical protein
MCEKCIGVGNNRDLQTLSHIVHPTIGRNPNHNLSGGRHLLQVTNSITYSIPYYGQES